MSGQSYTRLALQFTAPRRVSVIEEPLPQPDAGQALVQAICSAISSGTERLIYRDQFPKDLSLDQNIASLGGQFHYPLKYGYAVVGRIIQVGSDVPQEWLDRLVFAFQPHQSHFLAKPDELFPIPDGIAPEDAAFFPNMETAVNLVMDGNPRIGEQALVCGQGIIGLLTTSLLAQFPLHTLVALDRFQLRRQASLDSGVHACLEPDHQQTAGQLQAIFPTGADLVYELSGSPEALDQCIALTGFAGRIIIGSWYGQKRASLNLGGRFHRSRIRLISSQVSTLSPELSGRWDKSRRYGVAWEMLRRIQPKRWITHRFPIAEASKAYQLLDQRPEETIQIVLTYAD